MTNYYVKKIDTVFEWDDRAIPAPTLNNVLWKVDYGATTYMHTGENLVTTVDQKFFNICNDGGGSDEGSISSPQLRSNTEECFQVIVSDTNPTGHPNTYSNFKIKAFSHGPTLDWVNYGWVDPSLNYSGWITEICNYFETAKSSNLYYGTDNGEVNLVVLRYWFVNNLGSPYYDMNYVPFFYIGNDPNYDSIEVV